MTTDLQKAGEVARHVSLKEIVLRSAHIETDFAPLVNVPELALSPKYRARYELPEGSDDQVFVTVDLDITARSEEATSAASLSATFLVVYGLPDARSFSEDSLTYFASLNGVYNVWPYWRELIHTSFNRIGLGSVVLPVHRVKATKIDKPGDAASDEGTPQL